jgi:hypothetical protein
MEVLGNPGIENEISPDCPWNAVYPTQEACFEHCESLGVGGAYRAMMCFEKHKCQTTIECIEEQPTICVDFVDAATGHCPENPFWPPSVTLAKSACNVM